MIPKIGGSFLVSWTVYVTVIGALFMIIYVGGGFESFMTDWKDSIEAF